MFDKTGNKIDPAQVVIDELAKSRARRDFDSFLENGTTAGRLRLKAAAWENVCIAQSYRETDFDLLPNKIKAAQVLAWKYGSKGLLVTGPTRAGKTRACWLLLRRVWDEGHSVRAFDGIGWFLAVKTAFMDENTERWLRDLVRVDVLFLDDIFRGRMTEAQDMALWGILERRTTAGKPVIITTNATSETLREKVGGGDQLDPIISRIKEFCNVITF